jgi:hypothetical protein
MTQLSPEPPTILPEEAPRGFLPPKIWAPVGGFLAIGIVVLGLVVALGMNSDDGGAMIMMQECKVGEPGCELRQRVHEHADFALYIRGEGYDFGQERFLSSGSEERSPNVHIHDPRNTVVHLHREQTTWDEFLSSLGFAVSDSTLGARRESTCLTLPGASENKPTGEKLCNTATETWKFFVNGVPVDGIATTNITELDRVLISYGDETVEEARAQFGMVTDQACIPSELCTDRLPAEGEPPEPCSKSASECH